MHHDYILIISSLFTHAQNPHIIIPIQKHEIYLQGFDITWQKALSQM